MYEVFGDVNCLPATELDCQKRGAMTAPLLLPAELRPQIMENIQFSELALCKALKAVDLL